RTPTVKALVDWRALEKVLADFHKTFPAAKQIRHAAGHPIDLLGTPKRNAFSGNHEGQNIKIENSEHIAIAGLDGNKAFVTIEGKIQEYELSARTVMILRELQERALNLFEPAVENIQATYLEKLRSASAQPNKQAPSDGD